VSVWWQRLSARDRGVLVGGAFAIAALLLWSFGWYPLARSRAALAAEAAQAEADLGWMRSVADDMIRARSTGAFTGLDRGGRSLLALADGTARDAGLGATLQRIEPIGTGRVNLWFEGVAFDAMVSWLEGLQRQYGIRVDELSVERSVDVGTVNARVGVVDAAAGAP
jgi:general secretion pathway protein M